MSNMVKKGGVPHIQVELARAALQFLRGLLD